VTAVPTAGHDAELSGAAVRRLTRRATAARADTTLLARLGDLWGDLVSIAIGIGVLAGWVASLRERISLAGSPVTAAALPAGLTGAITVVIAVAGVVVLLDRLGPVNCTPAAGAWWLPLPARRRGLLTGELRRVSTVVVVVTGVLAFPVLAGLSSTLAVGTAVGALAVVAGCAAALVGGTAVNQTRGRGGRLAPTAGVLVVGVLALGAIGGTVAAGVGQAVPDVPAPPPAAAAALALTSVPLLVAAVRGLDRLGAAQLRTLGATSQYAAASAVTLDTRELGRALAARTRRPPARSRRFVRVRSAGAAVVAADATAVARAPWQAGQLVAAVAVPVLVARTEGLGALPWALCLACLAGWALAAVAAGHPARLAHVAPAIDRLLPLSSTRVVVARAAVPLALLAAVTTLTGVLLGVRSGAPVFWTTLCAATAPAWAAAAIRGALRPEVDWSGPVVSTPMGAVPAGVGAGFLSGVDVGVLGSLPFAAALLLDVAGPGVVAVQLGWAVALGAGALALVARRRDRVG
jgi:hypothetical protein